MKIALDPLNKFGYNQIDNHDFRFVLLDGKLRALHSPFMCKDYLQDIFWAEYTKAPEATVYGLTWKGGMVDMAMPTFPLAVLGGKFDIAGHAPYLLEFLNRFEAPLGIPFTSIDVPDNERRTVICWMDKDWTVSGPLLSAYTSLIRIAGAYKGGDPIDYLKTLTRPLMDPRTYNQLWKPDPPHITPDVSRISIILPKLNALFHGKRPTSKWADTQRMSIAHNLGIMGDSTFPTVAVK